MHFQKAKTYVFKRLHEELPQKLYYHGVLHTIDVCRVAEELAFSENLVEDEITLLCTAAVYHDIGFIEQYFNNESVAVRIACESLPDFGYSPAQIETISNIILATRIPQTPHTLLEEIMCDADLDYLGREDFFIMSRTLQQEWIEFGLLDSEEEWIYKQVNFFQQHRYFTRTAKERREKQKNRHLQEIKKKLQE